MVAIFSGILNMSQWTTLFENNLYFHKYSTDFHVCVYLDYFFYEKYDWSSHSMMKCKFKKVNNWTTTTYALMGAFDYTTIGVTMPVSPWSGQPADMS